MQPYKNAKEAKLIDSLRLNDFQQKALFSNPEKYDLDKLVKKGVVIYAPIAKQCKCLKGRIKRLFFGPRADLVGENKILVENKRHIKLYRTGFYHSKDKDGCYWADSTGRKISRKEFFKIIKG
jgi:hypothetical protein